MCGIAGIFLRNSDLGVDENILKKMRDTMIHRGPDEAGIYINGPVGLAHRRLSIIDLTSGQQPMSTPDMRYHIVFNGEVYNYAELKRDLESKGIRFRTNSDTETILNLYSVLKEKCVEKLNGMFSFVIWDTLQKQLFCARDRLGKKPFFYTCSNGIFAFSSEIKALLSLPFVKKAPNYESIDAYLSFGYIPGEKTAFSGIFKLLPGHIMNISTDNITTKRYWNFPTNDESLETATDTEKTISDNLIKIFDSSVAHRLISEVPLGAFLSGGVDSTSVIASMKHISSRPIITTTIGFNVGEFDESKIAENSARYYGTDHKYHSVVPDAAESIKHIANFFDEPFADTSAIPTYYVCKLARKDVTVALSGDGGDETFAGYNWYNTYLKNRMMHKKLGIAGSMATLFSSFSTLPLRGRMFLKSLGLDDWDALLNIRSIFDSTSKEKLYDPSFLSISKSNTVINSMKSDFIENTSKMDYLRKMQYFDYKYYLPDDILVKVDRMSMANSLEVRAPLLDHILTEFAWTIPSRMKFLNGKRKIILKNAMEPRLPPGLLSLPKRGFTPPISQWLTGPVKDFVTDTLFSSKAKSRGHFKSREVENTWNRFLSGSPLFSDLSLQIWTLLMLELWYESYIDN